MSEAAQEHFSTPESFTVHTRSESPLGSRDQQMLSLERQWWKYAGAKEQAIRELFDLSATHYYQILNALIDTEDALAHDPMLVKRLRRLRTSRATCPHCSPLGLRRVKHRPDARTFPRR
ncbi:hypothetical protein QFZ69_003525 [Arthrobacter sp. V1I7]|nr:hypothetical protein [Arthrobacter sp. V1I7]